MDTIGCGHIEQPGRKEADWPLKRHMLHRTMCACLIIGVQRISVGKVNVLLLPKFVLILVIKPKEKDC